MKKNKLIQFTVTLGVVMGLVVFQNCGGLRTGALDEPSQIVYPKVCSQTPDPGPSFLKRLSAFEYNNTVRDVLAVTSDAGRFLPASGQSTEFSNLGEAKDIGVDDLNGFFAAAEEVSLLFVQQKTSILSQCSNQNNSSACIFEAFSPFIERLFRRPLSADVQQSLLGVFEDSKNRGDTILESSRRLLEATLMSSRFLYLNLGIEGKNNDPSWKTLDEFELASRLSYFLWASAPDEELFQLAKKNSLRMELNSQVDRMLKSTKSEAFILGFVDEWLGLSDLENLSKKDPSFSSLKSDFRKETLKVAKQILLTEDRDFADLLKADFTFVNPALAQHYGLNYNSLNGTADSEGFKRASTKSIGRKGILTHSSVLSITSDFESTSIVRRGHWLTHRLLCEVVTDPPPEVVAATANMDLTGTPPRMQMEGRLQSQSCSQCHAMMDPVGLGFEAFGPIGLIRQTANGFPVDTMGQLPNGFEFDGVEELTQGLLNQGQYRSCVSKKLMTYALGRYLRDYDLCTAEWLALQKVDSFSALIVKIVQSDTFQMYRGEGR